ncbi:MAG: hypothetical protein IJ088_01510, partial [Clostridia bacterium]|nr:hypothetical protein [Clostridia bacterium]
MLTYGAESQSIIKGADQMTGTDKQRRWKLWGPIIFVLAMACLVVVSGVLDRQKTWLGLGNTDVQYTEKPTRNLQDGDSYGEMTYGPYYHLPAGTYRLRWFIECDGVNRLRLVTANNVQIIPEELEVQPDVFEGEAFFTLKEAADSFQIVADFCGGTQIQIYDFILDSPVYHDYALTCLLLAVAF